jgi:hypothetical protein
LFTPVYGALILRQPWHTFAKSYTSGLAFLGGLLVFGSVLNWYTQPSSWVQLAAACLIITLIGSACSWFIMSKQDRRLVIDFVPGRFRAAVLKLIPSQM